MNGRPNRVWPGIAMAAVLMAATLPGRTQGLGLITEPLLGDLRISRTAYADLNLWATLIGAAFCLPAGWLIDRFGLRSISGFVVLLLGITVCSMSFVSGGFFVLLALLTLTRGLGQSALSVVSITAVGKSSGRSSGPAMAVYSVLLTVLMAVAFGAVGCAVRAGGWRSAWLLTGAVLVIVVTPLAFVYVREKNRVEESNQPAPVSGALDTTENFSLPQALRTPAFWIFGGGTALFALVSSGLGLFNEAVLAELGFGQKTFHYFLVVTTLVSLAGQFLCARLARRWPIRQLMGVAMFLYGFALVILPFTATFALLWAVAVLIGGAAGIVMVTFFAVWSQTFGKAHLGRIQGMAQLLTVLASATGPLLFARLHDVTGSYMPLLFWLAPMTLLLGFAAWHVPTPRLVESGRILPGAAAS